MTPEQLAKSGTEDAHQMALFAWAALEVRNCPQLAWLHSVPNGGLRSARTGARMKATGARKGIWDVFLPVPVKTFDGLRFGLYIEMKKPASVGKVAGRLTPEQKVYQKHLTFYHYDTKVCYSWEEARDAITFYVSHIPQEERDNYRDYLNA